MCSSDLRTRTIKAKHRGLGSIPSEMLRKHRVVSFTPVVRLIPTRDEPNEGFIGLKLQSVKLIKFADKIYIYFFKYVHPPLLSFPQENVEEEEDEGKDELEDELLFEDDSELEEDGGMSEEEEEEEEESTKRMILRQIASMASKLREIIGILITTAGKVMVTILLGLTGMTHTLLIYCCSISVII